jgi:hypothetical protein
VLGHGVTVAEVTAVHKALDGSDAETARYLGLPPRAVSEALAYAGEHPSAGAGHAPPLDSGGALETAGRAAALIGGLAAWVYIAGGVVLAARLDAAGIDWKTVIGQVPREFLLTIGIGQVLFPSALVAAVYFAVQLLRHTDSPKPQIASFRERAHRGKFVAWNVGAALVLVAPAVLASYLRGEHHPRIWYLVGALVVGTFTVGLCAFALQRGVDSEDDRARMTSWDVAFGACGFGGLVLSWMLLLKGLRLEDRLSGLSIALGALVLFGGMVIETRARMASGWGADWAAMRVVVARTGLYSLAIMPAVISFWAAAVSLPPAKVCTTEGFAERGDLIGTGDGGVYLAEDVPHDRRVAAIPADKVEELFIGHKANRAQCDPRVPAGVVLAHKRAGDAVAASEQADRAASDAGEATDSSAALASLTEVADQTEAVRDAVEDTAGAVTRELAASGAVTSDAARRADEGARRARATIKDVERLDPRDRKAQLARIAHVADSTAADGRYAAHEARRRADLMLDEAAREAK